MRLAAEYYTANGPYFAAAAHKVLNDPAYIPTEKLFNKMTQNSMFNAGSLNVKLDLPS